MVYIYALIAASSAIGLEVLYNRSSQSWFNLLPFVIPMQIAVSYSIYKIIHIEGNILVIGVMFSTATFGLRFLYTILAGHNIPYGTWVAAFLITVASLIKIVWR